MSSLINLESNFTAWRKAGKSLPNPEDSVGFRIDPLKLAPPEELAGPRGEEFVASAKPEDAPTVELIRNVVTSVNQESERIRALDDVEGKDIAEGKFVASPEGSLETYSWKPDFVNWSGDRGSFSYNSNYGSHFEFAKVDERSLDLEIYASKSGNAPATFVIFDRNEESYTVVNQAELTASEEADKTPYLIGG